MKANGIEYTKSGNKAWPHTSVYNGAQRKALMPKLAEALGGKNVADIVVLLPTEKRK